MFQWGRVTRAGVTRIMETQPSGLAIVDATGCLCYACSGAFGEHLRYETAPPRTTALDNSRREV
jgi:hypothetical protein